MRPKILIIRFSSIGDIVLTSPIVRCLKGQLKAEVHFLTKKRFARQVEANPHLSKVYAIDQRIEEVLPALRAEAYDYLVDLHKNLRSYRLSWTLGKPTYHFNKLNRQKWLLVNWKINHLPTKHLVDLYFEGLAEQGIRDDGEGLDYFIPAADEVELSDFFTQQGRPGWENGYLALVIGATYATKRLPTERLLDLARQLPLPTVLLGGPDDVAAGRAIAQALCDRVLDTSGQLRLNQSASLVRQAQLVISHDTGLMHIAAAFRRPIISIWGNTVPAFGMYPYYPRDSPKHAQFEVSGLSCRPCSKIGSDVCPRGHFHCMQRIDLAAIARLVREWA